MTSSCTRAADRDSVFLMADLVFDDGRQDMRVRVRNLSSGGMMAEGGLWLKRGTRIVVHLRNIGPVAGVVIWARSPKLGIAFAEEIDPSRARSEAPGGDGKAAAHAGQAQAAPRYHGWHGRLRRA